MLPFNHRTRHRAALLLSGLLAAPAGTLAATPPAEEIVAEIPTFMVIAHADTEPGKVTIGRPRSGRSTWAG
jgi:hypothetical protein